MARAKGLLLLLAAARSMTSHAADFGAPATASMSYSTYAAASRALSAASGATAASSTAYAAAAGAPAAAYAAASGAPAAAYAAASGAPAIASRLLGSPAAPVGGGGNRYTLGIGALAAFAATAVMLTTDPMPEWDLVPEHHDAQNQVDEVEGIEDGSAKEDRMEEPTDDELEDIICHFMGSTRPPSARELRRMRAKMQKNEKFWKYLEDAIKKVKIILAAVGVVKEAHALIASTVTGSIVLIEKYGDPVHYFQCPFSAYTEVTGIFLFTVKPKDNTQQGESSSVGCHPLQIKSCSQNKNISCTCEVYGHKVTAESLSEEEIAGLKEILQTMDADGSGAITYDDLKEGFKKYGSILKEVADVNNSGTIDYIEQACEEHNMPDAFLDDVIKEADQEKDGRIDYGEFVAMMTKGNGRVKNSMRDAPGAL